LATSNNIIDGSLSPTDFGDVCFNYDKTWFAAHKFAAPTSISELALPKYKGLTVIENPKLSSTGLSFLAATIDVFGSSQWESYWRSLKKNAVKVDNGWEAAYYTDFSGSSGKGTYPIVLSYASSPADEVRSDGQSQTASILDGCFRQTEYAGVLTNAKNPKGAKAIVKYLLGAKFQVTFPQTMYMYPILAGTPIPTAWSNFTQIAPHTYGDRLDFNANRKSWLAKWSAIFE
jgi:thiamine transport system substrate-binding protein